MPVIRTLVVTVSPLLTDLVQDVLQPRLTLDIIGVLESSEVRADELRAQAPDLILLGQTGSRSDADARRMLATLPLATVLVIAPNSQHAWLYEMRPHRTVLTDLSVRSLVKVLASRLEKIQSQAQTSG